MKVLLMLVLAFSISILAACQSAATEKAEIKQVSVREASEGVKKDGAQFIDVRTVEEYKGAHAPNAQNLPLDGLEKEIARLDKNKPVYVICQTGKRSQKGAEILRQAGFKDVYNITGGTSAWMSAGLPTEKVE
jgi:rhodanese-related sulfurtransferase